MGLPFFLVISFALGFSSPLENPIFKPPRSQCMGETKWDQHLFHANSGFLKTALFKNKERFLDLHVIQGKLNTVTYTYTLAPI